MVPTRSRTTCMLVPSAAVVVFLVTALLLSGAWAGSDSTSALPGDELSLGELLHMEISKVVTASTYAQDVTHAPSSISIITGEDMQAFGYRTLAEALASIKGVYTSYDRNYTYLGMRGFSRPGDYNTRVLLMVDGEPLNDNVYNEAFVGSEFPVDIDLVDRVEVIRGPASSLYGSSAFFGVINVITRRPSTEHRDAGVRVGAEAGSFQSYTGRVGYEGQLTDNLGLVASFSGYDSKGAELRFAGLGSTGNTDYERYGKWFLNAIVGDFQLQVNAMRRRKGIPTGAWGMVFDDPRNHTVDQTVYATVKYERSLVRSWSVAGKVFYKHMEYLGGFVYDYSDSGDGSVLEINRDDVHGKLVGAEVRATKSWRDAVTVVAGVEGRSNFQQDQKNFDDLEDDEVYFDDKRSSVNGGVFAQAEVHKDLRQLGCITLNAGGRYDYYHTFGGTFNPRAGLIYGPADKMALKILVGTAFRAPNVYELYYEDSFGSTPNPDLKPERITTVEGVWEQYVGRSVRYSAAGFYYRVRDLITQMAETTGDGEDIQIFRNAERVTGVGGEAEVEVRLSSGVNGLASYTFQTAVEGTTNVLGRTNLTNDPQHMLKARALAPVVKQKVSIAVEFQFLSGRRTLAGTTTNAAYLTNVSLWARNLANHRLLKGLGVSLEIHNLFDFVDQHPGAAEHYIDAGLATIPQDGRTFRATLDYAF